MKSAQTGFTLMELMISLIVLAILLAVAMPSFQQFTSNNRVTTTQNDLVAAINLARSEAVRRSTAVTICSSTDGLSCGASTDWPSGWIVFRNPGAAGTVAANSDIIQKWGAIQSAGAANGVLIVTPSAFVQFQPTGLANVSTTVDVSYTGCTGARKRHLQITLGGSISSVLQNCP